MILETLILAVGVSIPPCENGSLFRLYGNRIICVENKVSKRISKVIRRDNAPAHYRRQEIDHSKERKPTIKPRANKPFGNTRYDKRVGRVTKRSLIRGVEHVLQSRDLEGEKARRISEQKIYSDKRLRR